MTAHIDFAALDKNHTACVVLSDGFDALFRKFSAELDLQRVKAA